MTRLSPAGTPISDVAISNIAGLGLPTHTGSASTQARTAAISAPAPGTTPPSVRSTRVQAGGDEGSPRPYQAHGVGKRRIREGAIETDDDDVSPVAFRDDFQARQRYSHFQRRAAEHEGLTTGRDHGLEVARKRHRRR